MSSSIKLKNANGKTVSVTNSNANQTDKEVIYLNTVDELANASGSINAVAIVSDLNRGGTFEWSSTGIANGGTVFAGASGYWNRQYSGAVNVKWFGAKGDGVTDDTVAIQSAVTNSKVLEGNSGDVYLLNQPIIKTESCNIDFKGATLDFSNSPIDATIDYFSILGSEDSEIEVIADVALRSKTITVSNTSSFSQGDMIRIGSDAKYDANSTNQSIGEILTIDSVSGNVITTVEPTSHIYLMSDNAVVSKLNMLENVIVKNFNIIGAGHGGVDRTQHGLVVKKCKNPQITNVHTNYVDRIGIQIADCVDFLVDKCSASNTWNSGSGYGISILDACQDGLVRGFVSENTRHTTSTNNTTAIHGIPRRIKFVGCIGKNSINNGDVFDTHTAAEDIHFEDCHVLSSSGQGFNIECRSATLVKCSTDNTIGNGISVHNESDYFGSISISDVRVLRSGGVGVKIDNPTRGSSAQYKNVKLYNITIDTTVGTGLYIRSSISDNVENITISNVLISNVNAVNAMYLLKTKKSVFTNIVINGTALNTTGLRVSDGKNITVNNVVFNLVENSPTGCIYLESTALNETEDVLVDNISVNAPVNTNSTGVRILGNTKNIRIGRNLNISKCKVLINATGLTAGSYIGSFEYKSPILSGSIDYVSSAIEVDTEGGASSDDLTTINGGKAGDILTLTATDPSRAVTVVTGVGNIRMNTNFTLDNTRDSLTLINNGGFWIELARATYN